jgi:hypothetical protein
VRIIKDDMAGRYFAPGFSGPVPSRDAYAETEPVHTIVADRDAMPHGRFAAERNGTGESFRRRSLGHGPPGGVECRKYDRRQRQVEVLLDTRATPSRRQCQSVDEKG